MAVMRLTRAKAGPLLACWNSRFMVATKLHMGVLGTRGYAVRLLQQPKS